MRRSNLCWVALALSLGVAGCAGRATGQRAYDHGNYARARSVWHSMARRGNAEGQFRLGTLYALGQGVVQDEREAARWFRAAAGLGHAEAQSRLLSLYLQGRGQAEEDPHAEELLVAAAEQGNVDTEFKLGVLYLKGMGISKKPDEGLRWLKRASAHWPMGGRPMGELLQEQDLTRDVAELGLPEAQLRLGQIYDSGQGVPQSHTEAVKWYYLAARQGFVPGMIALGWSFAQGIGVPQDPVQAARWYQKAAQRGDPWAQHQLGLSYQLGVGVERNLVQSHLWFNLAAAHGYSTSRDKRDEVASQMTASQLAEAERLALAWQPSKAEAEPTPAGEPGR